MAVVRSDGVESYAMCCVQVIERSGTTGSASSGRWKKGEWKKSEWNLGEWKNSEWKNSESISEIFPITAELSVGKMSARALG